VLLNGISPFPQISLKFNNQKEDFVNGNDFIKNNLGPNAERRHKHFRRFFGCQDPLKVTPPRSQFPLWKIKEFLDHCNTVGPKAWLLNKWISVDEQTNGFKGKHADKLRINYKKEGDGFQCDALCNDGYTYSFYFWNEPPPSKYAHLSALHARVLALFDTLVGNHHRVGADNLYICARLSKESVNHKKKVLMHSVYRTANRGLSELVIQDEKKHQQNKRRYVEM